MSYLLGQGHDIAYDDLVVIDPQPRSKGLQYARTTFAASGAVVREGRWLELEWSVIESDAAYDDLLEQFGLDLETSAPVTVWVPGPRRIWQRFNGTAIRPATSESMTHENYFIRDVTILIRDMELSS